jgi:hypothetical protein
VQSRILYNGTEQTAGFNNIFSRQWPAFRVLFHVTRKADADCVKTETAGVLGCDFTNHPGPTLVNAGVVSGLSGTDTNVTGGVGGVSGAVREYTRTLCRAQDDQHNGKDPYTGTNFNEGETGAVQGAGFTTITFANRTPGSRCDVRS